MPATWSIRHYLIALILAITLPLAGLLAFSLHRNHEQVLELAGRAGIRLAELVAADTLRYVADSREFLEDLAARPATQALDAARCDPILADIKGFFKRFANVAVLNREGQMVCSALRASGGPLPSFAGAPWFAEARAANRFHIGGIHVGPLSGKWVAVLSVPIRDGRGEFAGLVGYSLDLAGYRLLAEHTALPAGMSIVVVDGSDRIALAGGDSRERIGQPFADAASLPSPGDRSGTVVVGSGDERRMLSFAPIGDTGWRVVASRPARDVLARLWLEASRAYLVAAFLIAAGALLALFVARHIVVPVRRMSNAAKDVAAGELGRRAEVTGPREIVAVAAQFNHMLDVRLRTEAKYRDLLESASDAIVVADGGGTIVLVNDQAERMFGYGREELLGRSIQDLVPAAYREGHAVQMAEHLRTPQKRRLRLPVRGQRKDGSVFPCEIGLSTLMTDDGPVVSAIVRDITEQQRAEREIQDLNAGLEARVAERTRQLEAANQELESFSFSVSHDLRAPLRAINGFAAILVEDEGARLSAEGRAMLARITRNVDKMDELIDDVLEYSRAGRLPVERLPVDLAAIARDIAGELAHSYPGVAVTVGDMPPVSGDVVMLRQVMQNLIGNACKFSAGGEAPRVEVGAVEEAGETVFFVRDNGAGFDMAHAEKLFGMFQRLHSDREFAGTGVGLAIVKRLVERHGGRIWADAAPGRGATFRFTLP